MHTEEMVENEIPFLSWAAFKQMAPPILHLEITRLERLIAAAGPGSERYNALVRARFELKHFSACLQRAEKGSEETCAAPLRAALLTLSMLPAGFEEEEMAGTLAYIMDRIQYVHNRMALIY